MYMYICIIYTYVCVCVCVCVHTRCSRKAPQGSNGVVENAERFVGLGACLRKWCVCVSKLCACLRTLKMPRVSSVSVPV